MKQGLVILSFFPLFLLGQTPEKQGLKEYLIPDKKDTIHFYINQQDNVGITKIFLYLQGTGAYPMVNADDSGRCCFNSYPKLLMKQFPKDYAFVYINKIGLPYYVNNTHFEVSQKFIERNNVLDRAEVANKVLNYILKNVYPKAKVVAVLGHSEGTHVLARLVSMNDKITHICFASGSGHSHLYDEAQLIRTKENREELTAREADAKLTELYTGVDSVLKSPGATNKYFKGDTYKWWYYEINKPPIEDLVRLKIPIFLTAGSNDSKVPIEGSDFIKSEFKRLQKNNLTYKVYLNCDHGYQEILSTGERKDHWNELFYDFLKFVESPHSR